MKSMFLHDLKVACRSLLKYKLQTVISVVGLAVGLTCFVVCNRMLRDHLMWDRRLPHVEDIYFLASPNLRGVDLFEIGMDVRDRFPEIEKTTAWMQTVAHSYKDCVIDDENGNKNWSKETFIYSDYSFIDFFDFEFLQGNWEVVKKQADAIVLTESAALRMFGTLDVVGKTFMDIYQGAGMERECKVAALIADFPQQTFLENVNGLVLNTTDKRILANRYFESSAHIFFRLQQDVNARALNNKMALYLKERPDLLDKLSASLKFHPHLERNDYSTDSRLKRYLIISGVGLLVLLAAIFNYVLLMSGRILNRQKEYGIRQIIGATSKSVFRMFTTEITLFLGLSVLLSFVCIELVVSILTKDGFGVVYLSEKQNWLLIFGAYLLEYAVIVWGVMMGICWLILKRFRVLTTLQHIQGGGARYKNRMSNVLLGLQLTICVLLSGGSFFLYAQQEFLMKQYRGKLSVEECQRTYSFYLNSNKLEAIRADFQNMVNSNPHIEVACWSAHFPLEPWRISSKNWNMEGVNHEPADKPTYKLDYMCVDANYATLIRAKIEEGRFFRENETHYAVVNREFVRHFVRHFGINPLGKEISINYDSGWETFHVVGVMENTMNIGAAENDRGLRPCIYLPYFNDRYYTTICNVKLLSGASPEVLEPIKSKMQEQVYSFTELWIRTLEENVISCIKDIQSMSFLLSLFASICIIICLLGIYSSMMLAVEKRGREMAIRKINGARLVDIGRIFVRHYFVLLGIAALIAFPALYLGVQIWLESYTYRVPITPFPFIAIFVVLFAIVLLTIGSQLLKIMRVNPVKKLKSE